MLGLHGTAASERGELVLLDTRGALGATTAALALGTPPPGLAELTAGATSKVRSTHARHLFLSLQSLPAGSSSSCSSSGGGVPACWGSAQPGGSRRQGQAVSPPPHDWHKP